MNTHNSNGWYMLPVLALALMGATAHAQDAQTTRNLIDALVESNVLTREKADALLKDAQQRATVDQTAKQPDVPNASATLPVNPGAATASGKPVIRVPYVPESMRAQIRDEVKEEVLTQARAERWGVPNAASAWTDRIRIEGDIRIRHQADTANDSNTSAQDYLTAEIANANGVSRSPDFSAYRVPIPNTAVPVADTRADRQRERLRLRLSLSMKVTDEVGVGVRLATGSVTDRVSTNQTMGQNFNKYQMFLDRAFVRLEPTPWLSIQAGRIPNPWFSSEMTWSENLNFEGYAATLRHMDDTATKQSFLTVGYFPLREDSPPSRNARSLWGAQVGTDWQISARTRLKIGLAYYQYHNIEGRSDTDYTIGTTTTGTTITTSVGAGSTYGQYEYPIGLRQKGNTVFETNPLLSGALDTAPVWGLAYQFKPIVLTAAAEFKHFSPVNILLSGEYANNTGFNEADFRQRATDPAYANVNPGGKKDGYQLKLALGATEVRDVNEWQIQATYRNVGSDAVLDAFTDSDLGLGGTNLRGYVLGGTYGLYRNSTLGLRYMAAESIDPTINSNFPDSTYKVNSLQVDLNVRF